MYMGKFAIFFIFARKSDGFEEKVRRFWCLSEVGI